MLTVKSNLLPTVSRFFEDDWNSIFDWSNRNSTNSISTLPLVNIAEKNDLFLIEMAVPGMKKEDFKIEIKNNKLFIEGESKNLVEEKEANHFERKEFNYSRFKRSFNLDINVVDHEKIDASYEDGILNIQIPKKEQAKVKPPRQIEIQ